MTVNRRRHRRADRLRQDTRCVDDARAGRRRHRQVATPGQGSPEARDGGRMLGPEDRGSEARGADLRSAARVGGADGQEGRRRSRAADRARRRRLVADRAGFDIVRLRGDIERLMLYTAGKPNITLADAQESRQRGDRRRTTGPSPMRSRTGTRKRRCGSWRWRSTPAACRTRSSASSPGSCATRWPTPRRIPAAIDALFRDGSRPEKFRRGPEGPAGAAGRGVVRYPPRERSGGYCR